MSHHDWILIIPYIGRAWLQITHDINGFNISMHVPGITISIYINMICYDLFA